MRWTGRFDEPIGIDTGRVLHTLRDAADHITALPRQVAELEHWQDAIACLIAAAQGKATIMMAKTLASTTATLYKKAAILSSKVHQAKKKTTCSAA